MEEHQSKLLGCEPARDSQDIRPEAHDRQSKRRLSARSARYLAHEKTNLNFQKGWFEPLAAALRDSDNLRKFSHDRIHSRLHLDSRLKAKAQPAEGAEAINTQTVLPVVLHFKL